MQRLNKSGPEFEQGACVELRRRGDLVCARQAIRSADLRRALVPEPEMPVVGIEAVDIERAACAFTNLAERELPEPADFPQHVRNFRGVGNPDLEFARFGKQMSRTELFDLGPDSLR